MVEDALADASEPQASDSILGSSTTSHRLQCQPESCTHLNALDGIQDKTNSTACGDEVDNTSASESPEGERIVVDNEMQATLADPHIHEPEAPPSDATRASEESDPQKGPDPIVGKSNFGIQPAMELDLNLMSLDSGLEATHCEPSSSKQDASGSSTVHIDNDSPDGLDGDHNLSDGQTGQKSGASPDESIQEDDMRFERTPDLTKSPILHSQQRDHSPASVSRHYH